MKCQLGIIVSALFVAGAASTAFGQIFTDDMSTGTNWTIVKDSDASAVFGFDYSTRGVPSAPNGSDTIGLKFEVNNNDAQEDFSEIAAINANAAYTGEFTFRVDIWSNWAPDGGGTGTGTTEFVGVTVGHDASTPSPIGGAFIYSGDGDSGETDYRMYKDGVHLQSESGQYAAGTVTGARDNSHPYYTSAFPSVDIATAVPTQGSTGTVPAGAGGFQWMTLNVEVDTDSIGPSGITTDPGFARVSMRSDSSGNTIEIGTIDNSNDYDTPFPAVLEGSVGVLMSDIFTSVTLNTAFSFGIFDNVQVLDGLVPLTLAGDFNSSGVVDGDDFLLWQRNPSIGSLTDWEANYGMGALLSAASAAVPEPTTCTLTLAALCLVMSKRRIAAR
jgi:hypothetical protein